MQRELRRISALRELRSQAFPEIIKLEDSPVAFEVITVSKPTREKTASIFEIPGHSSTLSARGSS